MKKLLLPLFSLCLLGGCSSTLPLNDGKAPLFDIPFVKKYQVIDIDRDHAHPTLVVGEYQGGGRWRWSQSNAFGAPLARQNYADLRWQNDGFLPPNARATQLFTALMVMDNIRRFPGVNFRADEQSLFYYFRGRTWLSEAGAADGSRILHSNGMSWEVRRLP